MWCSGIVLDIDLDDPLQTLTNQQLMPRDIQPYVSVSACCGGLHNNPTASPINSIIDQREISAHPFAGLQRTLTCLH